MKQIFATKGTYLEQKKKLKLANNGYTLMDQKRSILMRELSVQLDRAKVLRLSVQEAFAQAYYALQMANMSLGRIDDLVDIVDLDCGVDLSFRSVMGVEIPIVLYEASHPAQVYGIQRGDENLDQAMLAFEHVKVLMIQLVEIENSVYRLANAIAKTQKRANALQYRVIPETVNIIHQIGEALEEKEREEFIRQKVIKQQKRAN